MGTSVLGINEAARRHSVAEPATFIQTSEPTMTAVLNDISEGPALQPAQNHDQPRGAHPVQTLGELLRTKREARGLSQQQAAEQLRLLPHWIDAFENNRFDSLVAPVYSRGYLRKYAILLELPPEEILARYEKLHDLPPAPVLTQIKPTASPPIRTSKVPAILGGIALVGVTAALIFTQMETDSAGQPPIQAQQPQAVESTVVQERTAQPVAEAPAPEASVALPESTEVDAAGMQVSSSESSTPEAAPQTAAPEASLTPVSVESAPAPPAAAAPVAAPEPAPAATGPDAAAVEEPLARLEVSAPRGKNLNLKLSFKANSWATVYAADGTRLLYELGRRGRPRTLSSPAPLTVIVGAIDAVEMRVNNKLVPIPRQPGKDSIKFILDVEGASRDARSASDTGG